MKVFLLWYNDWEENTMIGIFSTKELAEEWRSFFILNPDDDICMRGGNEQDDIEDREDRLEVQEWEVGSLNANIKIDNLKFLEFHEGKSNAQKIKESSKAGKKLGFIRS